MKQKDPRWKGHGALLTRCGYVATGIDDAAIDQVQASVRKRLSRTFVARGHLESHDAKDMAAYAHGGGFSVNAGVRIETPDRAGLVRLLRYCARPPFRHGPAQAARR